MRLPVQLGPARPGRTIRRAVRRLRLARYWQADGDLDEAAAHAYRAMCLVQVLAAPPMELALDVAQVTARIERDRDRPAASLQALTWISQLLDTATPDPATPDPGTDRLRITVLVELGDCHRRAGRYPAARAALHRAQHLIDAADPVDPGQAAALATMQGIIAKELGEYHQAATYYATVGRIHDQTGTTLANAATLQHNLAGLDHIRGRYPQAESHARRAVQLRRQAPASTEVDIAMDLAVLAAALAGQHRHHEARELFEQAMAACQRARPPRRYEIAVHLHNLATIDQATGEPERAEQRYRQALALKAELLGPDHPETALVANNLATLLVEQHRPDEAATHYRHALSIMQHHYPPEHPTTATIRGNLTRTDPPACAADG